MRRDAMGERQCGAGAAVIPGPQMRGTGGHPQLNNLSQDRGHPPLPGRIEAFKKASRRSLEGYPAPELGIFS